MTQWSRPKAQVRVSTLARAAAAQLWREGGGQLPPGWDYEEGEGKVHFVSPEGQWQWEDPRETLEVYEQHLAEAEGRGVDLRAYFAEEIRL